MRKFINIVTEGDWTPAQGLDEFVRTEFTCGGCGYLALALHDLTGWPIRAFGDDHIWVINPQGRAVDINGVHPEDYALTQWDDGVAPGQAQDIDPETLRSELQDSGMLKWAREIIEHFPEHFGL